MGLMLKRHSEKCKTMWTYIDEFDFSQDYNFIHCDTRDFCILGTNEDSDVKIPSNGNNKFTREEIKEFLKSVEEATGGKGSWRCLSWNHKNGWWKYLRWKKYKNDVYWGYVELGRIKYPIDKKFCTIKDIDLKYINFIRNDG